VTEARRFENINLLRAFAALAVVTYHVIEHGRWSAFPAAGPLVVFRIGWAGVDLFFAISGFVIAYSALILYRKDPARFPRSYWLRRLTRIVPLYVATMAAWIALMWPGFFEQPARVWAWQLFTHLTFIHDFWPATHSSIDGVNWSLAVEMQFYVAVALGIDWLDRTPGWRIWLYGILIAWAWRACTVALYGGTTDAWPVFMHSTQLPGTLDEFGAGIFLAKWVLDGHRLSTARGVAWIAGACVAGYFVMSVYWSYAAYWFFPAMVVFWKTGFAAVLLCILAAAIELPQVVAHRWLRPLDGLGEVSYGIYLWHLFALQWLVDEAELRGHTALAAVVGLTLVASMLSWRYFEKPLMSLGRRVGPGAAARELSSMGAP
jgi:peptidoglycan/LPS O-acetylase OafA/YrhL